MRRSGGSDAQIPAGTASAGVPYAVLTSECIAEAATSNVSCSSRAHACQGIAVRHHNPSKLYTNELHAITDFRLITGERVSRVLAAGAWFAADAVRNSSSASGHLLCQLWPLALHQL
jgi:hypothetical protein